MENERRFYVYIYRDPRNSNQPFYIGKGHNGRAWVHLKSKARTHFINVINKIRKEGLEPVVEIYKDNLLEEEAFKLEMELIKRFGRKDKGLGTLCNKTDGGEGSSGLIHSHSEETKRKISKAHSNTSPETRRKLSEINKGKIISEEQRRKISNTLKGNKLSEETKRKISNTLKERIFTEEHKRRISEAKKGKSVRKGYNLSEEHKRKIGEANKGKIRSSEERKNISLATKKGMTEEVRRKLSESLKKYFHNKKESQT